MENKKEFGQIMAAELEICRTVRLVKTTEQEIQTVERPLREIYEWMSRIEENRNEELYRALGEFIREVGEEITLIAEVKKLETETSLDIFDRRDKVRELTRKLQEQVETIDKTLDKVKEQLDDDKPLVEVMYKSIVLEEEKGS